MGKKRLHAAGELDFFAKFGTQQSPAARKADAYWLVGLGLLGKGQLIEARKQFEAALQAHASHLGAGHAGDGKGRSLAAYFRNNVRVANRKRVGWDQIA